jgi:hypothetical protein
MASSNSGQRCRIDELSLPLRLKFMAPPKKTGKQPSLPSYPDGVWCMAQRGSPGESYLRKESTILCASLSVIEITEDCSVGLEE